jgi:hypothetical protein
MIKAIGTMTEKECFAIGLIEQAIGTVPTQAQALDGLFSREEIEEIKGIAKKFCVQMMKESFGVQDSGTLVYWGLNS